MISFEKYTLSNGLTVILHTDNTSPLLALNLIYKVGSRNEHPERTGLAHLLEHVMFEGTNKIPHYNEALQGVGGENNAYTNTDITNYYLSVPAQHLETALMLEADRMTNLAFIPEKFNIQRDVVIEEFKQRYLTHPFNDISLLLKPLCYKKHPYRWNTIGMDIRHIAETSLDEAKVFYTTYYCPDNAILSLAGNLDIEQSKALIEKYFGNIPKGNIRPSVLPKEPLQKESRWLEVERDVPCDMLIIAFHGSKRSEKDYYPTQLISHLLSNGDSSILQENLTQKKKIFTHMETSLTETFDRGLFIINGIPANGISLQTAEEAVWTELEQLKNKRIKSKQLEKIKNKTLTLWYFSEINIQTKARLLGVFEAMDKAERIQKEEQLYQNVDKDNIKEVSRKLFRKTNSSTIYYKAKN
ncbi:MAG: pitrilysin family protein [Bacteroidales bacterium]|jgi:predicted Zn-dependent peptidase|nr:pitrilysin family protein [Bacteroidales bacterium]MDD2687344.1 pitrilysin family protein [Bacteroidales bacterium]MDD3330201.1 pitrilysin family protein [Bacteroidales bacterium]MDD3691681.1 pitrilysin family protein [Bacteroidales bacterium]MDD4044468.1 pitrilysin family protein [Bacteroidales bacterium]